MKKLFTLLIASLLIVGCEHSDHSSSDKSVDEVPFSQLNWTYGGVKASGAKFDFMIDPVISNLKVSKNGLSFRYDRKLSAWGLVDSDASALSCLFVKNNSGKWVGGKFDWISSSRTTRGFENIYGGYHGWTLYNVPNPCEVCFVITTKNGSKRSNVIKGTWSR